MPSKVASQHRAERAIEYESADEMGTSDHDQSLESVAQTKHAKPQINRTTVSKTTKKRAPAVKSAATKKAPAKTKAQREALKDRTNIKDSSDTEEVEDFADEDVAPVKPKAKKSRLANATENEDGDAPPKKKPRSQKPKQAAPEIEETVQKPAPKPASGSRKAATSKRGASVEPTRVIPETQPLQDVSESIEEDPSNMDIDQVPTPEPVQRFVQRARSVSQQRQIATSAVGPRARSTSQQPRHFSRGRSASDAERRVAESESKKAVKEMTSKYEDMRLKYESLCELGQSSAESNFDKLKRATDQRAKDANDLIASLKKELSDLRKSASTGTAENARMKSQVESLQNQGEKQQAESKTLQNSLLESQNEVKSLTAKLEAARKSAATAVEAAKVPGSAVKSRDRSHLGGNLDSTKQAALREELYRDLTGLIINSIKRKDGEDEYSCIQTGRNGTLHFHLTVNNDSSTVNPKTPSGLSYEEAEFAYEPLLDDDRDRDLLDILPDYLTEDICFPRNHAVKFYSKVVECMTKRIVVEE